MLKKESQKIVVTGLMLALGILLPFSTSHAFGVPGTIFLPMHIPVFLCGFLCGPIYAGLLGAILPLLNSMLTGMPVLYPIGIIMTIELLVYALSSGFLYKALHHCKKLLPISLTLIASMILGRIAYGITGAFLILLNDKLSNVSVISATVTGIPGIIIQLILIPSIIFSIGKFLNKNNC